MRHTWWLIIGHVVTGLLLCLTIIGIPLGLANFKLIAVTSVHSDGTSSRSRTPSGRHSPRRSPCRRTRGLKSRAATASRRRGLAALLVIAQSRSE
jgi:hypothetical protein